MTIRNCSAKIILVLWCSGICVAARPHRAKPKPKRAAAPKAVAAPAPASAGLAGLVREYRQNPTPAGKSALLAWAASHPKDAMLAQFAFGIAVYEQKDFPAAMTALRKVKLPAIADYTGYYLAASELEAKESASAAKSVQLAHTVAVQSPLGGKAWILEARARQNSEAADAIGILREHYAELPQPEGDLALADAYQAAGDLPHAADFYQRVFYEYPAAEASVRAAAALVILKETMGEAYPQPLPQQVLGRADRLLELRDYVHARSEYEAALALAAGADRDRARIRIGAADLLAGRTAAAYPYLRGLEISDPEVEAERLYYLEECARRLDDEDEIKSSLEKLAAGHSQSAWRSKALLAVAARDFVANRADDFVPLYKAVYEDFPNDPAAALAHWRVTFQSYFHDKSDAVDLLREHLTRYPAHSTAAAAIYFLGRHAEQQNDFGGAAACYRRLATTFQNYYYGGLGRDRLRRPEIAAAVQSTPMAEFLAGLKFADSRPVPAEPARAAMLRIERSRILRSAGLPDLADSELRFGARTDGQPALLAMEMAASADAPYQAVRFMKIMSPDYLSLHIEDAPRKFWEYLFPLPYRADLTQTARDRGLDPWLVAGLIRQESEFNPGALSRANAYGMMQVRPGTGREFARRNGIQRFSNRMLFQPSINLRLGTSILRSMLDRNSGNLEQTLAAYNAGPARAASWLMRNTYREPAEFVESIPYTETREYVQAVIRNADIYRRLYP
jgi:soluble lytic murein transglycosylase